MLYWVNGVAFGIPLQARGTSGKEMKRNLFPPLQNEKIFKSEQGLNKRSEYRWKLVQLKLQYQNGSNVNALIHVP